MKYSDLSCWIWPCRMCRILQVEMWWHPYPQNDVNSVLYQFLLENFHTGIKLKIMSDCSKNRVIVSRSSRSTDILGYLFQMDGCVCLLYNKRWNQLARCPISKSPLTTKPPTTNSKILITLEFFCFISHMIKQLMAIQTMWPAIAAEAISAEQFLLGGRAVLCIHSVLGHPSVCIIVQCLAKAHMRIRGWGVGGVGCQRKHLSYPRSLCVDLGCYLDSSALVSSTTC